MSTSGATKCGLQPLVDESFGGVAGGIGTAAKQGRVHYAKVTLPVAGGASTSPDHEAPPPHFFEVAFDVMAWPPHVNFDAIIGIDFLARYKATIDVSGNTLRLTAPAAGAGDEPVVHVGTLRKDGEGAPEK